jgi:hypothetical protein
MQDEVASASHPYRALSSDHVERETPGCNMQSLAIDHMSNLTLRAGIMHSASDIFLEEILSPVWIYRFSIQNIINDKFSLVNPPSFLAHAGSILRPL